MKTLTCPLKLYSVSLISVLIFACILNSQTTSTIRHMTDPSDDSMGMFTASSTGALSSALITVKDISISISNGNEKKLIISSDITVISDGKPSKGVTVAVKSYADPNFIREKKEKKVVEEETEVAEDEETEGEENEAEVVEEDKDPYEGVSDDEIPVKMYLEVTIDGTVSTYDFYDISDLESIVGGINDQYDAGLEVFGSGRNVSVGKSAPKKTETDKTVNKRINITKQQIDEGLLTSLAGFDLNKFESEILKDKILNKTQAKNFTVLIDKDNIYINGNQISNKLIAKYRKIFNNFSFQYTEE